MSKRSLLFTGLSLGLVAAFRYTQTVCHSEERSDEKSAWREEHKKQIPLPPRRSKLWSAVRVRDRNDRPRGTFMPIGGPKAQVTLGMTMVAVLFISLLG